MGQKAVLAFLSNWHKQQEVGKDWPLKFLKPGKIEIEDKDVDEAGTENLISNEDERRDRVPTGEDGGEKAGSLPVIPNQVETTMRKPFLASLSKETSYQKLMGLLEVIDVCDFFLRKSMLTFLNIIACSRGIPS